MAVILNGVLKKIGKKYGKIMKMVCLAENGLNITNIGLIMSQVITIFKNNCIVLFKPEIGDMEVVEDVFEKIKFPLDKSSNLWYNVYVS